MQRGRQGETIGPFKDDSKKFESYSRCEGGGWEQSIEQ